MEYPRNRGETPTVAAPRPPSRPQTSTTTTPVSIRLARPIPAGGKTGTSG